MNIDTEIEEWCKEKNLPDYIQGCQFGILNVSKNNQLIQLSKNTIAPLEYVPYIILYYDGKPFMCYEGEHTIESIKKFILQVQKNLKYKEKFAKKDDIKEKQSKIPAYTLGKPLQGDNKKCYLEFTNAYIKN